ncbi:unnamed protein product, partial [marine sediment metagenome]
GAAHLALRKNATKSYVYWNSVWGYVNDAPKYMAGRQECDENGDMQYNLEATGGDTLDIGDFRYLAVQVN